MQEFTIIRFLEGVIKQNEDKAQPNFTTRPKHRRGRGPNPLRSPPGEGGLRRR
jgi:hypothetical protein